MIDLRKLHNEITDVVAEQLHYFENLETINDMRTAAEVLAATEGGIKRYMSEPIYNAKVKMMVAHIMERVRDAAKESSSPKEQP